MTWPWNRPQPAPPPAAPLPPDRRGADFAWRVHSAQENWTARVDGKAALFLATQTAVLAALAAAWSNGKPLDSLDDWHHAVAVAGTVLSVLAVLLAGLAVIPLMRRSAELKADRQDNLIYFGHLRHWKEDDLNDRLTGLTAEDELRQLSRQLVQLSDRNWKKHARLRAGMVAGAVGALLVLIGYFTERIFG